MKTSLKWAMLLCLSTIQLSWGATKLRTFVSNVPLAGRELDAIKIQRTMEAIYESKLARPVGNTPARTVIVTFRGAPLSNPNAKALRPVLTRAELTVSPLTGPRNCWLPPWRGQVPENAANQKFASLGVVLFQHKKRFVQSVTATVKPAYAAFDRQPNSPVYLLDAFITQAVPSKGVKPPVGAPFAVLYRSLLQASVRAASSLIKTAKV